MWETQARYKMSCKCSSSCNEQTLVHRPRYRARRWRTLLPQEVSCFLSHSRLPEVLMLHGLSSILNRSRATIAFALVSSRYQISAASHDDTTLVSYNPSSGADRDKQIVQTRILAQLSLQYPTNSSHQTQADAHMSPVTELAPENTGSTPPQATIVTSQPEARLIFISPDNLSLPPQQSAFSFWPTAEQIYASMAAFQQESFKSEVTQVESSSSSLHPPQQESHLGSGTLFLCRMLLLGAFLNSNK